MVKAAVLFVTGSLEHSAALFAISPWALAGNGAAWKQDVRAAIFVCFTLKAPQSGWEPGTALLGAHVVVCRRRSGASTKMLFSCKQPEKFEIVGMRLPLYLF